MATKSNEPAKDDDDDDDQFDGSEKVLQAQTPVKGKTVDQEGGGDASQANGTLVPAVDLDLGGV